MWCLATCTLTITFSHYQILTITFSLSFTFSPTIRRNSWRMWCLATCAPTPSTSSSTSSTGCTDTITRWPWWGRNLIYLISYMTIYIWQDTDSDWLVNRSKILDFMDFFEQKRTPNFAKMKGQGSRKKPLWRNHSAKVILLVQIFLCIFSPLMLLVRAKMKLKEWKGLFAHWTTALDGKFTNRSNTNEWCIE